MAEDLTEYMHEQGIRVRYMHSDVETLERIEIIRDLRLGAFDVLIGINLLREGLDIPECALVAILDADKEGFLRSETSLIQTIGRAARNVDGKVILYADRITGSMERAMAETSRRRAKQEAYNTRTRHHAGQRQDATSPTSWARMYERDHVTVDAGAGWPKAAANSSATTSRRSSPTSKSRCAPPPPTWNSRKPPGCATSSSGCNPPRWPSPTIPSPGRATSTAPWTTRSCRRCATARQDDGRQAERRAEASEDDAHADEAGGPAECAEDVWEQELVGRPAGRHSQRRRKTFGEEVSAEACCPPGGLSLNSLSYSRQFFCMTY